MQPILAIAALLVAFAATPLVASDAQIWVPGHWQTVGSEQVWVPGAYCARPVTTTTTTTTTVTTVTTPPPATTQVWVDQRWVWNGTAWQLQPAHWEVVAAPAPAPVVVAPCPPPTVIAACPPPARQVVEVHHYHRPRVTYGVGVVIGGGHHHGYRHHRHHRHHDRHHVGGVHRIPPPLPGSHFLPRPPRNLPDPLGVFRHDPLGIIRR